MARRATVDPTLDVQILQTASSMEVLALLAYDRVLAAPPGGPGALTAFAIEFRRHHEDHKMAFQARTTALDPAARVQDAPNPKFLPTVTGADLGTPQQALDLLTTIEKTATDTYVLNLSTLADPASRALVASVMAVQARHLAVLRTVSALLAGGTPELVAAPLPLSSLMAVPAVAGKAAFPDALHAVADPAAVAEPSSGAIK